ncbi:hypothetical protein KJ766_00775 [Patescibacteria group bacterium]|nr:hypothetical protein [Patescibacteria group bacterium]
MKKLFAGIFVAIFTFLPISVDAARMEAGETFSLSAGEVVEENLYSAGNVVSVSGAVMGDLFAAGSSVVISGEVLQDANVAGGDVSVFSDIGEDLRAFGGTVTINGSVGGELITAGGMVTLLDETVVNGDVYVAGGAIKINGTVHGDVVVYGGEVTINGIVDGNVKVETDGELTIGSGAVIAGSLEYKAPEEATFNDGFQVMGGVAYEAYEKVTVDTDFSMHRTFFPFKAGINLFKILFTLTAALVLMLIFKKKSGELSRLGVKEFGTSLLVGLIALIVIPFAALLIAITVVGIKLALILVSVYVLALMIAKIFATAILGWLSFEAIQKWFKKPKTIKFGWEMIVIGVFLFFLIGMIPIFGFFFKLLFTLVALGAILLMFYREVWLKR